MFHSSDKFARVCRKEGSEALTRLGTSIVWGAILGFYDVTIHMRRCLIFFTAQKGCFLNFAHTVAIWKSVSVDWRFFNGILCIWRNRIVFSKHMEQYSSLGLIWLVLCTWVSCAAAFYLPGLAPISYCVTEKSTNPACLVRFGGVNFIYLAILLSYVTLRTLWRIWYKLNQRILSQGS